MKFRESKVIENAAGEKHLSMILCIRVWHPSFWAFLWQSLDVRPRVVKPVVWAWLMGRLLLGKGDDGPSVAVVGIP
jgi:hypothetical protein